MFFKVLAEEKKPKLPIQEPQKKLPAKPDEAVAVLIEEPPKKGIDLLFVCRAISLSTCHTLMRNT